MRKVLLGLLLGASLLGSLASTRAYGVISVDNFWGGVEAFAIGLNLDDLPVFHLQNEEMQNQEAAHVEGVRLVLRGQYLLGRMQDVFSPREGVRTPIQNRILEAQRQHLQAEWDTLMSDLYFRVDNGLGNVATAFFANQENRQMLEGAYALQPLEQFRIQLRLERALERENSFHLYLGQALESASQSALEGTRDGFSPAVAIAEAYRWARYCYDHLEALNGRGPAHGVPAHQRFADQVAYWDTQIADEVLWGSNNNEDAFGFEGMNTTPVTLDRVIEIRDIHTHYGEQTQIIIDDGELTQPHAHWGDLFEAAQNRAEELIERGDMRRAEIYRLFALYLKTGNRAWFLLLKSYSNADGPVQQAYALPELSDETARLVADFLAVYLSNPENELQGSVYRSILLPYLGSLNEVMLQAFLTQLGQHLSPDVYERMSVRVGYARLIAECLGSGLFALQPKSQVLAYELLVAFIGNHLKIKGPFEGQPSLTMIVPLIRTIVQPGADLSEHQLGRLLSWVQRMLGGVGFKNLLKKTYNYSDAQIEALVKDALSAIGMIAGVFSNVELPNNEVIGSLFNLFGYYTTDIYATEASEAMRRVLEHWSPEHMEAAFNDYCTKKMLKRTWAKELEKLKANGVIS